jgi:hypothetical protein
MHLKLSTAVFLEELQTAARVASTRSAVQALSGVQLHAGDDGCELRATDMEVGLRLPLSADVETPGDVVLPARLLLDVVRSLPGAEVTLALRVAEQDVEIVSDTATFRLRTLRNEDFPTCRRRVATERSRSPPSRSSTRSRVCRARPRATTRAPSSPASSCRPPTTSCGWSPPTPTA